MVCGQLKVALRGSSSQQKGITSVLPFGYQHADLSSTHVPALRKSPCQMPGMSEDRVPSWVVTNRTNSLVLIGHDGHFRLPTLSLLKTCSNSLSLTPQKAPEL